MMTSLNCSEICIRLGCRPGTVKPRSQCTAICYFPGTFLSGTTCNWKILAFCSIRVVGDPCCFELLIPCIPKAGHLPLDWSHHGCIVLPLLCNVDAEHQSEIETWFGQIGFIEENWSLLLLLHLSTIHYLYTASWKRKWTEDLAWGVQGQNSELQARTNSGKLSETGERPCRWVDQGKFERSPSRKSMNRYLPRTTSPYSVATTIQFLRSSTATQGFWI